MRLRKATWLEKDEIKSIAKTTLELGEGEVSYALYEYLDSHPKDKGAYVVNLFEDQVLLNNFIDLSRNYNLL